MTKTVTYNGEDFNCEVPDDFVSLEPQTDYIITDGSQMLIKKGNKLTLKN
jgi:hypothetical protein